MKNKLLLLLLIFLTGSGLSAKDAAASPSVACDAYFSWEKLEGNETVIVFHNESTGNFNTWMWDFGDGNTSGLLNPAHDFVNYGEYIVCLTISDGDTCNSYFCDTVFVTPECEADFDFTYVPTTPIHIQFTDLSYGNPDEWLWDFGDGNTSSEQNPVHPYPAPGTYQVCLTMYNSHPQYPCQDSVCKTVIIPDSVNCEAAYEYSINPYNQLELSFYNNSTGNITEWTWDFGDGTISHEMNPVHQYAQAAEYLVCLNVENSDTTEHCFHFICKTIDLSDTVVCVSDFSHAVDSSSNVMYRHYFYDNSVGNPDHWMWNFGDGNTSTEQNPVHVYDEPGTFEVCLESWNSNYPGCNDSYCQLLQTESYHQLGGQAFIGENPINNPYPTGDTGVAVLYRQRSDFSVVAVDTTIFTQLGYYWFTDMMELPYIIRIGLSSGSENYKNVLPTYYPQGMTWQQANAFSLGDDMFEMHTSMVAVSGSENGIGIIRGRVVDADKRGYEIHKSFYEVPVILTDQNSTAIDWTTTDEYGQFEFVNIALGSYMLYADIAGIYSLPESVVLEDGYPVVDTIRIEMHANGPLSINDPIQESISILSLYPNPVNDQLNIEVEAKKETTAQISIYNISGQMIQNSLHIIRKENNILHINTENFTSGMYLLIISTDDNQSLVNKKFIKK